MIGEYDGAAHRVRARHRRDVAREQRYRDAGLEHFTVVAGDVADERLVVDRACRPAHGRCSGLPRNGCGP